MEINQYITFRCLNIFICNTFQIILLLLSKFCLKKFVILLIHNLNKYESISKFSFSQKNLFTAEVIFLAKQIPWPAQTKKSIEHDEKKQKTNFKNRYFLILTQFFEKHLQKPEFNSSGFPCQIFYCIFSNLMCLW